MPRSFNEGSLGDDGCLDFRALLTFGEALPTLGEAVRERLDTPDSASATALLGSTGVSSSTKLTVTYTRFSVSSGTSSPLPFLVFMGNISLAPLGRGASIPFGNTTFSPDGKSFIPVPFMDKSRTRKGGLRTCGSEGPSSASLISA